MASLAKAFSLLFLPLLLRRDSPASRHIPCLGVMFWALVMVSGLARGASPIVVSEQDQSRFIGNQMLYLVDEGGTLTIQDIIENEGETQFQPSDTVNFGYSDAAYWFRLDFLNQSHSLLSQMLEVGYPLLDDIQLFTVINSNVATIKKSGDTLPFSERDFPYQNVVFLLEFEPQQQKTVYLRVKTESSLQVPLTLWSQLAFAEHVKTKQFGLGIYYGTMIVMVIYNLFLFFAIRDRVYLYYVAYITSFIVTQLGLNGLAFEYLWPTIPTLANKGIPFWVLMVNLTATLFWRSFLNLKTNSRRWYWVASALAGLAVVGIILNLLISYSVVIRYAILLTLVNCSCALIVGIYCWKKGVPTAHYYVIAWLIFLIGSIVKSLTVLGLLPTVFITEYAQQIGSCLEVILLSLGLADRINHLKRQARMEQERFLQLQLTKNEEEIKSRQRIIDAQNESNKLKDEFLATLSHEMRTPMNGVIGAVELVKRNELNEKLKQDLALAEASAENMINLVDRLLDFTQIQSGISEINNRHFNLYDALLEICERFSAELEEKHLTLNVNFEPLKDKQVFGDKDKVISIVRIFLENAIKFTNEGTITCEANILEDEQIIIAVSDTGIGIDSKHHEKIFEPFCQLDAKSNRKQGGLGIGLSTAKALAKTLSSDINIESNLGQGTRFSFCIDFPIQSREEESVSDLSIINDDIQERAEEASKYTVLIAEDNQINRLILTKMVRSLGYNTVAVENGKEAVKFVEDNEAVNLVLMDCQMPIMDGFEATTRIRQHRDHSLPIIAVTANITDQDKKRVFDSGMDDLEPKPVKLERIQACLQHWLLLAAKKDKV